MSGRLAGWIQPTPYLAMRLGGLSQRACSMQAAQMDGMTLVVATF